MQCHFWHQWSMVVIIDRRHVVYKMLFNPSRKVTDPWVGSYQGCTCGQAIRPTSQNIHVIQSSWFGALGMLGIAGMLPWLPGMLAPASKKKSRLLSTDWWPSGGWSFIEKNLSNLHPCFFLRFCEKNHFYKKVVANQSNLLEKRDSWINNTNASSWNCFLPREVIHAGPMDHCCHRHLRRYRRNTSLAHRKRAGLGWVQRWKFTP